MTVIPFPPTVTPLCSCHSLMTPVYWSSVLLAYSWGAGCSLHSGEQALWLAPTWIVSHKVMKEQRSMVSERHQGGKAWRISFFTCSNISSTLKNSLSASLILPMCFRKLPTKSIILHLSVAVTWERLHSRTRTGRKQTGLKDTGKEQMPGLLPLQDSTAVFLIPFVGGDRLFSLFLFVTSSFGFLEITPHCSPG